MSTPGQLGDGDRKIPFAERSRIRIGNTLYELLAAIRRKDGVDPTRYASVELDMQYDITRTMVGAEVAARETAALLLPAILTGHAPGRFRRTRALLRHPLFAGAVTILAVVSYLNTRTFERPSGRQEYYRVVGQTILESNPEVKTTMGPQEITITISGNLLDGTDASFLLKHKLSVEDYQRLRQESKK